MPMTDPIVAKATRSQTTVPQDRTRAPFKIFPLTPTITPHPCRRPFDLANIPIFQTGSHRNLTQMSGVDLEWVSSARFGLLPV